MPIIAPSLLASNFLNLQAECEMINESEAEWFHLDVMDGQFVPNISYGIPVVEHIRRVAKKPCDVHLMIERPEQFIAAFHNVGADIISIHIEACKNLHSNIQQIKSLGMRAGVAVNPHTPVESLSDILQDIDVVNLMSVNPGFGGQEFIPHTLQKIRNLKRMIHERGLNVLIEIDGGVTLANAKSIVHAGADVLVAGSTVFKAPNPKDIIVQLKYISD